jgi:hypothetical protein
VWTALSSTEVILFRSLLCCSIISATLLHPRELGQILISMDIVSTLIQRINEQRNAWLMENLLFNQNFPQLKSEDKRILIEKGIFYQIGNSFILLFVFRVLRIQK